MSSIADLRKEYQQKALLESEAASDAMDQFSTWWKEATSAEIDEVNAMTLATVNAAGVPDARIVLLKGYDRSGFTFFTNYGSSKGQQLGENPQACLVFFWKELERQVRIHGRASKISEAESDEYFHSRPSGSRLGAWVSPQSRIITGREWLEEKEKEVARRFDGKDLPRPEYWGGYRIAPDRIEFWQGRPNRLHDRLLYVLAEGGNWTLQRLAP